MSKQMIVNANAAEEIRVAITEKNRLVDLDIESQKRTKHKGNIYKGIVANVEDSLEAAFIEFGDDKQGFLALSEVRPALYPAELKGVKRPKISQVLKRGQEIIVQITKDEIGSKGAAVTSYLSLPGRYVVLMHSDDSGGGISRKIDDEKARRHARDMLARLDVPKGMAVIIRTAGMHREREDLLRDLQSLAKEWEQIDRGAQLGRAPTLLHKEPDLVVRTIRDYFSTSISKIIIDNEEEFEDVKGYFEERIPDATNLVQRHEGTQPIFEKHGIENAIEELFDRSVTLNSGGELVIDQTEALVAIDVNSARSTKEGDHEATVYKTNLEAAKEVARQLRLRDLGGIILIDFIDMSSRKHERDVERALKDAMRDDRARVKLGRISENGTLELTRQRLRQAHRLISFTPCKACEGTGLVRDPEGLAVKALRKLAARLAKNTRPISKTTVSLPVDVANILNNKKRRDLIELSDEHQMEIEIVGDIRMTGSENKYEDEKRGRAGIKAVNSKDPRLEADSRRGRGRNNRRGRRPSDDLQGHKSVPPPSIGPVPRILTEDELPPEYSAEKSREAKAEAASARKKEGVHFEDPIEDALFGDALDIPLQSALVVSLRSEGPARKSKRRRRTRRPRNDEGRDGEREAEQKDDPSNDNSDKGEAKSEGSEKRRRPRKARSKKVNPDDGDKGEQAELAFDTDAKRDENEGSKASSEADADVPKKKRAPRKSRAKKVEPASADAADTSDTNDAALSEEPKRRRRTPRRKIADAPPSQQAAPIADSE